MMKQINNYILEKLHIDKNFKLSFKDINEFLDYIKDNGLKAEIYDTYDAGWTRYIISKDKDEYPQIILFAFDKGTDWFFIHHMTNIENKEIIVIDDEGGSLNTYDGEKLGFDFATRNIPMADDKEHTVLLTSYNNADKIIDIIKNGKH